MSLPFFPLSDTFRSAVLAERAADLIPNTRLLTRSGKGCFAAGGTQGSRPKNVVLGLSRCAAAHILWARNPFRARCRLCCRTATLCVFLCRYNEKAFLRAA